MLEFIRAYWWAMTLVVVTVAYAWWKDRREPPRGGTR